MGWQWRQVKTREDVKLYADTLTDRQPQYYADPEEAKIAFLGHIAAPIQDYTYHIGTNDRRETAVFRIAHAHDLPMIDQYGASGPNYLTAFARGVPAVRDRMADLGITEYDIGEVRLDRPAEQGQAGQLLDAELLKLTSGAAVVGERVGSTAKRKRYRMAAP